MFFPTSFIFIIKLSSINNLHLLIILDINVDVIEVIFDDQNIYLFFFIYFKHLMWLKRDALERLSCHISTERYQSNFLFETKR